jgi:hypothetical protein
MLLWFIKENGFKELSLRHLEFLKFLFMFGYIIDLILQSFLMFYLVLVNVVNHFGSF